MRYAILCIAFIAGLIRFAREPRFDTGPIARLEINATQSGESNKIISLGIVITNNSNNSIYLSEMKPPEIYLRKKKGSRHHWDPSQSGSFDPEPGEWKLMRHPINVEPFVNLVYETSAREGFINPEALKVYRDKIKASGEWLRSKADSLAVESWVRSQLESVLYLQPHQTYRYVYGINSLKKGCYKIYFYYSNANSEKENGDCILNLRLPESLNGFQRWQGVILSDTLYLNIK